jgi:hypothetical protein
MSWQPEAGEMIEVKDYKNEKWEQRKFIALTNDGRYLCWSKYRTMANVWNKARPLKRIKSKNEHDEKKKYIY